MVNRRQFQKAVSFSKRKRIVQLLVNPLKILKYLFFTRFAFLIGRGIAWRANLFFGKHISGVFPDVVFSFLYLYGYSEEGLTTMILKYLKPGMIFFDIGAHIGYESVLASVIVGKTGKVYSFEPTPSTFEQLFSNLISFRNVFVYPLAAWSKTQDLNFLDYGPFYAGCNSYREARMPEEYLKKIVPKKLRVKAVSLNDFCKTFRIEPDFVKIDAESAELEVLKGMQAVIQKNKPIISIEIGDKEVNSRNGSRACIKLLEKLGYIAYGIEDGKIRQHKLKSSYHLIYDNLLFLPKRGAK